MTFVDSHAHLDAPEFAGDLDEVLARALSHDVRAVLAIGCLSCRSEGSGAVLQLAESRPEVYAAFGVHPHDARCFDQKTEHQLRQLMKHSKVLAVGEIGLDYHYDHSPRETQQYAFRRQIQLAKLHEKPIIIHSRTADADTVRILEEEFPESVRNPGVLHCFTGTAEMAERCMEMGFYVSFGGILTFKQSATLREIARRIPFERLLIETDSPYLAPVPLRGKRNEPAFVTWVAKHLAALKGRGVEEIGQVTTANFSRLFNLQMGSFPRTRDHRPT